MAEINVEELLKENKHLIRSLSVRTGIIERLGDYASQFTVRKFKELKSKTPKNLEDLSPKQLRTLNRDLNYLNSLKSSTKQGAIASAKNFGKIDYLTNSGVIDKSEVWEIYEKIGEGRGGLMDKFKYEILDTIVELSTTQDDEEIIKNIRELFDKSQTQFYEATELEKNKLFVMLLDEIKENPFGFDY